MNLIKNLDYFIRIDLKERELSFDGKLSFIVY
jgi:hypothetical protein